MANMSYCRFENTLGDLNDCVEALNNNNVSSDREKIKAKGLLKLMAEFVTEEGLVNEEGEVDYDAIEEFINECNDIDEE